MKRPFLLLEVLIAIALVALCAYPLLSPHYRLAGEKSATLRRLKQERAADEAFCEVVARLYRGEVEWEKIIKPVKGKPKAILKLDEATAVITTKESHHKGKRIYFRLLDIAITPNGEKEQTYHYNLYAQRLGSES
ncbi:MAG: hypothetical protein AB7F31_00140 [Parachlamydiales bacterium]